VSNDALDAITLPELRRRVDRGLALLREMRRALAVHAGMTLEDAPGPVPAIDLQKGFADLQEVMATLPLLARPLTAEERAELRPVSAAQNERMKEVVDELVANEEAYEKLVTAVKEDGDELPSHEQIVQMREGFDKTDMLAEFQRELSAFAEEMRAFQEHLREQITAAAAAMAAKGGPPS
jgi:hypothetical protein